MLRSTAMYSSSFAALLALLSWPVPVGAENWPQWRGPKNNGISNETKLAVQFGPEKSVAWRLHLPGPAGSTPVIWNDRIFLTSAEDSDLLAICVRTDGKELWRRKLATGNHTVGFGGAEGNLSSPSPCTDGEHVWFFFGTGTLACFDFDGNEKWNINLQERYGPFDLQFGMHSTPVLDEQRLFLQVIHGPMRGDSEPAYVVALDKATGKEIWKQDRKTGATVECKHSYASPILYDDGKLKFLLTHGGDYIVAHRLSDGQEIWRHGGMNPPKDFSAAQASHQPDAPARASASTELCEPPSPPEAAQGQRRNTSGYNATLRFVASPVAVPGLIVVPSAKKGNVLGLRPDIQGDATNNKDAKVWTLPRGTPDVPSPLVHDGLVYLVSEDGVLMCLDAKTGETYYHERMHAARHRASPIYADGHLYVAAFDGHVTVVKAGKKFEIVAQTEMKDPITASPAVSNGTLYVRSFESLWAFRK
jgi:outer membrane protein assembly factor BamB